MKALPTTSRPGAKTILAVDDEESILELLSYNLGKAGYRVLTAATGEKALEIARAKSPDLVLLDLMLPGIDGLDVCRALLADERTARIPIVMVTAKGEETDVVTGLELGAHDYITKPFSPRVLVARVRAILRRPARDTGDDTSPLRVGKIQIHPGRHEVLVGNTRVDLTATEFSLLSYLARRPGWVFSRGQIVNAVRGEDAYLTDRAVDFHVVGLRKKLGKAGDAIETVRGVGYRFRE